MANYPEQSEDWRFDPEHPPDRFTVPMIRRMSLSQVRELSDPGNEILNDDQQASFDSAYQEWWAPIGKQLAGVGKRINKKFSMQVPEFSTSLERLQRRLAAQASVPRNLGLQGIEMPTVDIPTPKTGAPPPDAATGRLRPEYTEDTTAGSYEEEVDQSADELAVLHGMHAILAKQHLSSTRGWFFALVVSVSVIVAGVAPIVTAETSGDRLSIILWTLGISILAASVYWCGFRRSSQHRGQCL